LRAFGLYFVDEFTETRFRVLELPACHDDLYQLVIALVRWGRNGGRFQAVRFLEAMPHFRSAAEESRNLVAQGVGERLALGEDVLERLDRYAECFRGGGFRKPGGR
jgi:hypothetical protein